MTVATQPQHGRKGPEIARLLRGCPAAHQWLVERGIVMPLRTFAYHVAQGHVPHLRLGRALLFWPHELRTHFRLPEDR